MTSRFTFKRVLMLVTEVAIRNYAPYWRGDAATFFSLVSFGLSSVWVALGVTHITGQK